VGHVILDFGCGAGTYTIPAAKMVGKAGTVYALDIDRNALTRLMQTAKREGFTNVVRVDAFRKEPIPVRDETLDLVLLLDVLQEVEDRKTVFDEIHRLLKPNGTVAIYPMHVEESEVERLAIGSDLSFHERIIQGRVLVFRKSNRSAAP
jgi:ubiquinone/menaquinone biosynthesis C-methylase UbiE